VVDVGRTVPEERGAGCRWRQQRDAMARALQGEDGATQEQDVAERSRPDQ
jgi:hypothetical protein